MSWDREESCRGVRSEPTHPTTFLPSFANAGPSATAPALYIYRSQQHSAGGDNISAEGSPPPRISAIHSLSGDEEGEPERPGEEG
jgi:hypothetical protein